MQKAREGNVHAEMLWTAHSYCSKWSRDDDVKSLDRRFDAFRDADAFGRKAYRVDAGRVVAAQGHRLGFSPPARRPNLPSRRLVGQPHVPKFPTRAFHRATGPAAMCRASSISDRDRTRSQQTPGRICFQLPA